MCSAFTSGLRDVWNGQSDIGRVTGSSSLVYKQNYPVFIQPNDRLAKKQAITRKQKALFCFVLGTKAKKSWKFYVQHS